MFEKTRLLNLLVCAVFGLTGGMVSHLLLTARAASAQATSELVRTKRIELIDKDEKVYAILGRAVTHPANKTEFLLMEDGRTAKLTPYGLALDDKGVRRMEFGNFGVRLPGGATELQYHLSLYDDKQKLIHQIK